MMHRPLFLAIPICSNYFVSVDHLLVSVLKVLLPAGPTICGLIITRKQKALICYRIHYTIIWHGLNYDILDSWQTQVICLVQFIVQIQQNIKI